MLVSQEVDMFPKLRDHWGCQLDDKAMKKGGFRQEQKAQCLSSNQEGSSKSHVVTPWYPSDMPFPLPSWKHSHSVAEDIKVLWPEEPSSGC